MEVDPPKNEDKGFYNLFENNCFLNADLQMLWHIIPFRYEFKAIKQKHTHCSAPCVVCALEGVMDKYATSEDRTLSATQLRRALAKHCPSFPVDEMADAGEVFVALLEAIHSSTASTQKNDPWSSCCVAHKVFGMTVVESYPCTKCGAVEGGKQYSQFTQKAWVAELGGPSRTFEQAIQARENRTCTTKDCKVKVCAEKRLLGSSAVFTLEMAWPQGVKSGQITNFFDSLDSHIDIGKVFDKTLSKVYSLRGLHYVAFFYSVKRQMWMGFDDTIVSAVGKTINDVRLKCIKGLLQPTLLFYVDEMKEAEYLQRKASHTDTTATKTKTTTASDKPESEDAEIQAAIALSLEAERRRQQKIEEERDRQYAEEMVRAEREEILTQERLLEAKRLKERQAEEARIRKLQQIEESKRKERERDWERGQQMLAEQERRRKERMGRTGFPRRASASLFDLGVARNQQQRKDESSEDEEDEEEEQEGREEELSESQRDTRERLARLRAASAENNPPPPSPSFFNSVFGEGDDFFSPFLGKRKRNSVPPSSLPSQTPSAYPFGLPGLGLFGSPLGSATAIRVRRNLQSDASDHRCLRCQAPVLGTSCRRCGMTYF